MGTLKGQRAQTAIEIAVFGAILIFALGAIVRSSVGRGNQQNAVLKATRLALTMSYDTSATMKRASRNSASVLIVEDRLTAGSDKYGPIDRSPFLMSGSGTHSSNIFMPVDFGDVNDLPLFDVFVNGQHFALTTSAFKTINLFPGGGCGSECRAKIWDHDSTNEKIENGTATFRQACTPCPEVEKNCAGQTAIESCADSPDLCDSGTCSDCSSTSSDTYKISNDILSKCAKLYSIIDHHPSMEKWCDGESISCPRACSSKDAGLGCNLSPDERFDLDRDGVSDVPSAQWERFAWQWYLVMGFNESESAPSAANLTASAAGLTAINKLLMGEGINEDKSKNIDVDVDQDLKMERIMAVHATNRIITSLDVRDAHDGDIDFSFSDRDQGIPPGFTKDINIYTKVRSTEAGGGTYLRIDEGKLFSADGDKQYIRTASKKDAVDIIERVFKLSNDTGRLCRNGIAQRKDRNRLDTWVEACNNCFFGANIGKTCFDTNTLLLFIRSRVEDYHGHKWVTDVSNDPYVSFTR